MLLALLENISLVTLAGLGYRAVLARTASRRRHAPVTGILFGAVAMLVTANPVEVPSGATFDGRAGPVVFAGYLGGPLAALLASALGSLGRQLAGGPYAHSGMLAVLLYGLSGALLARIKPPGSEGSPDLRTVVQLWGLTSIAAASMVFFIRPAETAAVWAGTALPLILLANGVSCAILGAAVRAALDAQHTAERLERTAERLQLASSAARSGVWDLDLVDDVLRWDDSMMELYGVDLEDDVAGNFDTWARHLHPEDKERAIEEALASSRGVAPLDTEFRIVRSDGSVRHIHALSTLVRDGEGVPLRMVGVNTDVTELRLSEDEVRKRHARLLQAEKLEAVGKLSGGIAHDFNNLLGVVTGNVQLALEAELDEAAREALLDARGAAERGARLTQQLLAFASRAPLRPHVIDPARVIADIVRLLRRTLPSSVTLEVSAMDALAVELDRTQLESALLNLVLNAKDAMPAGGVIRLGCDAVAEAPAGVPLEGPLVRLTVADDGAGMSADVQHRALEPFFTTKEVGRGSGMGLAMVNGFVRQSRGHLLLESRIGEGTRFALFFSASGRPAAESVPAERRAPRGEGRVLLVEDEPTVRRTLARLLRRLGYDVVEAANGHDALARLKAGPMPDVLLTDVIMPGGMAGTELATLARQQHPELPMVFITGTLADVPDLLPGVSDDIPRLEKPVGLAELAHTLKESLRRAS